MGLSRLKRMHWLWLLPLAQSGPAVVIYVSSGHVKGHLWLSDIWEDNQPVKQGMPVLRDYTGPIPSYPYGATLQISSLSFKVLEIHNNDCRLSGTVFPA